MAAARIEPAIKVSFKTSYPESNISVILYDKPMKGKERMKQARNVPVHIIFLIGFLYWVTSRYVLYTSPAIESVSIGRIIAANLGYLLILGLGYWLALTSPKKWVISILGLVAILTATLMMPLVGYVVLVIMFFVRSQAKK